MHINVELNKDVTNLMTIGENIRRIRTTKKMSQEELAKQLFVSRQTISRWETGKVLPTMENVLELVTFFEKPIEYFIDNKNSTNITYSTEKVSTKERFYKRYGMDLIYFFMSIIPFISIWTIPFAIYAYIYSSKKNTYFTKSIKLLSLSSIIFFLFHLIVFIIGVFNLSGSTTEVYID